MSEYLCTMIWALCSNHKSWQHIECEGRSINSFPYQEQFYQSFQWQLTFT